MTSALTIRGSGRVLFKGGPTPPDPSTGALLNYAARGIANALVDRPPDATLLLLETPFLIVEAMGGPLFIATMPVDCATDAPPADKAIPIDATLPHGVSLPLAERERVRLIGPAFLAVAGLDADFGRKPDTLTDGLSVMLAHVVAEPGPCRRLARTDWPSRDADAIALPGMGRFGSAAEPAVAAWLAGLADRSIPVPEPAAARSARLQTRTLLDGVVERAAQAVEERAFTPDDDPPGVPGP